MKRTLRNTASAKHIAKDNGLTFTYQAKGRMWLLASRNFTPEQAHALYAPSIIADYETDQFYEDCMRIAAHTATAEQMHKVFQRAKHAEMMDMISREGRDFTKAEFSEWIALDPTSYDKQVHAVEDAIYNMRTDAEEVSGTYAEHKAQFAGVRAVASYGGGKHIGYSVDGRFVMSLPAQLNGRRIPCPDECDDIFNGESILDSDGWRNRAHDLHDLARRIVDDLLLMVPGSKVGATMVATSDGTIAGQRYVMWCGARRHTLAVIGTTEQRLFLHWCGFLDNCKEDESRLADVRAHVEQLAEDQPAERRAAVSAMFDRIEERRAASMPKPDELPPPPAVVYVDMDALPPRSNDDENARALAAEEARAAAARNLSQGR